MKNIFILLCSAFLFIATGKAGAQTFKMQQDTVYYTYTGGGLINIADGVDNLGATPADSIVLQWKVIYNDLPSDWQVQVGVCDNNQCYSSALPALLNTSHYYHIGLGDFHAQANLSTVSNGTYMLRARLFNQAVPTDTAIVTFIFSKSPTAVPVVKNIDEVSLYPNPANNEVNIVYDASADVKNVAIYNIIGKVMTVYKVTGNSANLNIENIPSGIYFVRLLNSRGQVAATKKFTKQ